MDTKAPLLIILSLGVGVAMYQASGAAAIIPYGPSEDLESGDVVENKSSQHNVEEGVGGEVNPDSDSNIVGVIIGGSFKFVGLLTIPGLLSLEMMRLGIWSWAAIPLGFLANIITYIGLFQVVTGRIYE